MKAIRLCLITMLACSMPSLAATATPGDLDLSKFSVQNCEPIPIRRWVSYVLLGSSFSHQFRFQKGCDIQGAVEFKRGKFPVQLEVRQLGAYDRVKTLLGIDIATRGMAIAIDVIGREGTLYRKRGSGGVKFTADYSVLLDPVGEIVENRGGQIALFLNGKKPVLKPIRVQ